MVGLGRDHVVVGPPGRADQQIQQNDRHQRTDQQRDRIEAPADLRGEEHPPGDPEEQGVYRLQQEGGGGHAPPGPGHPLALRQRIADEGERRGNQGDDQEGAAGNVDDDQRQHENAGDESHEHCDRPLGSVEG